MNRHLIVLSKSAPPSICGMSDYSCNVANSLTVFYDSVEIGVGELPSKVDAKVKLPVDSWKNVLAGTDSDKEPFDILINYTPTSYSKWSLPVPLISALRKFKKKNKKNRVFIHFHETWNGSPNLKIHHAIADKFIKWSMRQLAGLADGIAVFTEEQNKKLQDSFNLDKIHYNLIGSSILPASKDDGLYSKRADGDWVVFGLPHTRLWTLKAHIQLLQKLRQAGKLKHIRAIGPSDGPYAQQEQALIKQELGEDVLIQLGALSPADVTKELLAAQGSFIGQSVDSLRKSSSFAALAAHAVPVVCNIPKTLSDPPGEAIFRPEELLADPDSLSVEGAARAKRLHEWFWSTRSWEAVGRDIKTWMENTPA